MNRHSTPPQTNPPYTNGHYETPLEISGVSLHRAAVEQKPTTFAADLPFTGVGPLLYAFQRFQLGSLSFARYLAILWLLVALFAAVEIIPGRWVTATVALLLLCAQLTIGTRYRRHQYVSFSFSPLPSVTGTPLDPYEKLPVYATGYFNVEGRYQRFSALPSFYRTFATGEHALLCRVQKRTWLGFWKWPLEETGMWYAFVKPSEIQGIAWGILHYGTNSHPAIELTYQLEIPPSLRRKHAELRQEVLYIATPEQSDAHRIYEDLLNNLPVEQLEKSSVSRSQFH